ncbi:hypothetical protein [Inquilinus limosus]|uniref:Uncharacterized protein n=1 Tax=Inquilinus limosus MP06 TaxID=1398085 RepID=A0A0A0D6K7_9PROT|nr:hypothetical protein [Inquilinus limosus]KGM34281.1 hypothetical protein P409_11045 [Inquilinus limosus MP06]
MGVFSIWHWVIISLFLGISAPVPGVPEAISNALSALRSLSALPPAEKLIDYAPEAGGPVLYRLPGNICFLRTGQKKIQVNWIRRDDRGRIEIIVSAPALGSAGHRFDPAEGTAQLDLSGQAVTVPVSSPGFPTWRFTLEETPALQEALDADEATLRFTAIRGGKPVPEETLTIAAGNLWQAIQGLESCAAGAELPGVVGP